MRKQQARYSRLPRSEMFVSMRNDKKNKPLRKNSKNRQMLRMEEERAVEHRLKTRNIWIGKNAYKGGRQRAEVFLRGKACKRPTVELTAVPLI